MKPIWNRSAKSQPYKHVHEVHVENNSQRRTIYIYIYRSMSGHTDLIMKEIFK